MFIQETPNPDAEILITRGDVSKDGAVLIGIVPFEFGEHMDTADYQLVISAYQRLIEVYEECFGEYINLQLRFNRDYVNI